MPKLFQINVCNNCYSSGKIVSAIGELAIANGWNSYIAYSRDYSPNLNTSIKIGNKLDVCLNALEQRLFDNTGFGIGSYFSTKQLVKELKKIQPDIIHLHVIVGYYLNFRVLFNYLSTLDIPIVWTLHSCWEITGHCTHFDYEGCERWITGCYKCPLKREYPQSFFIDNSRHNYTNKKNYFTKAKKMHLVAVSKWLSGVVSKSFLGDKPIEVIYNGVDTNLFKPSQDTSYLRKTYNLEEQFVAVALASTWLPKKGIPDYYKLADILPHNYSLVMIGFPKDEIEKLPHNIIGVPRTTDINELRDFYSMADVVLNLSYEESFGLTTVEGFACGTPAIVYDKTASPELVTEDTGFVVKAGDIIGVLESMKLIQQKGKESYTKACRERAMTVFDKDKNFKMYIELYNKLLRIE